MQGIYTYIPETKYVPRDYYYYYYIPPARFYGITELRLTV